MDYTFISVGARRRRKHRQGSSLPEALLSLMLFLSMTLVFAAAFPALSRSGHYSSTYSQAALLAQHKIDQIRFGGYAKLLDPAYLQSRKFIDSQVDTMAGGARRYYFTQQDRLASFFPNGVQGTILTEDYSTAQPAVAAGTVQRVTVQITWNNGGSRAPGHYAIVSFVPLSQYP